MTPVDISKEISVDTEFDGVVIQQMIEDIPGGRTLDVSGLPAGTKVVKAGHVIIKDNATNDYKALGVNGSNVYAALGSNTYVGILYVSVPVDKPLASIMVRGTVNIAAAAEAGLPAYPTAVGNGTALPLIRFTQAY